MENNWVYYLPVTVAADSTDMPVYPVAVSVSPIPAAVEAVAFVTTST
jgi:hypothetical protein